MAKIEKKKKEKVLKKSPEPVVESVETPKDLNENRKLYLIQEVARLRKLHSDQVELGINPDSKLEVLIANLDKELGTL